MSTWITLQRGKQVDTPESSGGTSDGGQLVIDKTPRRFTRLEVLVNGVPYVIYRCEPDRQRETLVVLQPKGATDQKALFNLGRVVAQRLGPWGETQRLVKSMLAILQRNGMPFASA